MANVLVEETSLSNIASAIREKSGGSATYKPGEMAAAISNLPIGGSSDNEDGLLSDTLINYENATATDIKNNCFANSTTLATAIFTNVSNVGLSAFSNCSALTQVSLPNAITIGNSCFSKASKLLTVNLSNAESLGEYAFRECKAITSINLPQVKALRYWAFYECDKLAKVDLGSCNQFIDGWQFHGCWQLTALIIRSNTVCSAPYSVIDSHNGALYNTRFSNHNKGWGYVYVPRALVNSYKSATNWAVIEDCIRAIEDYPDITGG